MSDFKLNEFNGSVNLDNFDLNGLNQSVIAEFRANEGKVGGYFAERPVLLLTTIGAKSGQPRISPLVYLADNDRLVIFGTKAGAPTNPDWYYNLMANPTVTVEVGIQRFQARATVVDPQEHERLFAKVIAHYPEVKGYQEKTTRKFPIITLERIS